MKRLSLHTLCAGLLGVLPMTSALAAVTSVTASPATERVALARATSVAITWNVATSTAGPVTVSSTAGQFRAPGGAVLATVNQTLAKTATGPATAALAETVLVSPDVIERARRDGHDHVVYRRTFTDGVPASGEIKLYLATMKSAGFGISRLTLNFEDGEAARTVVQGASIKAHAHVSVTGVGVLRAQWEIAGPNSDPGKPAWRVLAEVGPTLADAATLASPALPTGDVGFYLVRLQVAEPKAAFDLPVVRYVVRQE